MPGPARTLASRRAFTCLCICTGNTHTYTQIEEKVLLGLMPLRAAALENLHRVLCALHEQLPQDSLKEIAVQRHPCVCITIDIQ